jgi:hypothetical protein
VKELIRVPVHGDPGEREVMKTCIKFFFCSRISFICATWIQDVMQSNIFSRGTETSSKSSDSAEEGSL